MTEEQRELFLRPRPIELRSADARHWMNEAPAAPHTECWFRAVAPLPDDQHLHRAVLAYASDMQLLGTCILPHGLSWSRGEVVSASLDHAVWFHGEFRADDWLLYATDSPWTGGGRGYNRGRVFTRDGRLVASVAQEGMIRRAKAKSSTAYDTIGIDYARLRQPDPRIAARIDTALGDARTVLNVGAGTGSCTNRPTARSPHLSPHPK